MGDERLVGFARELEASDARLAAAIGEVGELQQETDAIVSAVSEIARFLDRLAAERAALEGARSEAAADMDRKRTALDRAQAELVEAERRRNGVTLVEAERAAARAADALCSAQRKYERAVEARDALEREAEAMRAELVRLGSLAGELAERLALLPRISKGATVQPAAGLGGVLAWAAKTRAALFVVRGGLESERERVVREANELGASALGDPGTATSVALVRERIERL